MAYGLQPAWGLRRVEQDEGTTRLQYGQDGYIRPSRFRKTERNACLSLYSLGLETGSVLCAKPFKFAVGKGAIPGTHGYLLPMRLALPPDLLMYTYIMAGELVAVPSLDPT